MAEIETSTNVTEWGKGWTWIVSAFQGSAIAVRAEVGEDFDYSMEKLPARFRYCHFTNVIFRPPNNFAFMPWPVEALGLLEEPGWMQGKELPFLRKPAKEMVAELERAWAPAPPEEEKSPIAVATSGDVRDAVADAKLRRAAAKAMMGGASGPTGIVK